MNERMRAQWERFKKYYLHCPEIGLSLDISRMGFDELLLVSMEPVMQRAIKEMSDLEKGAIANPDENRMVGHYWLRDERLAPNAGIKEAIARMKAQIKEFTAKIFVGEIRGDGGAFENVLVIGIGGSPLGPQFVSKALASPSNRRTRIYFLDNTDPDGIETLLAEIDESLSKTLIVVISKSGGTKETRNGMIEVKCEYEKRGLRFEQHAVAVTAEGSELDAIALENKWLERFPMWDWVGGRTSELSAVGLLPAELQGIDTGQLIEGARRCDVLTRRLETQKNPAALMALMWYSATNGRGEKDLVIMPYKDRLDLLSKYLQQLIMESLGKERDREGRVVNQGLTVYGNKGSTDQHAYVQQLRDGVNNFFVTFINVLKDRSSEGTSVEPGVTSGDYLNGFFMGTRQALHDSKRNSITLTVSEVDPFTVGVLIALFERTVGLYASLININAYHQPGVEAGKKAASDILKLQGQILKVLKEGKGVGLNPNELAQKLGEEVSIEDVFLICEHLTGSGREGIRRNSGSPLWASTYSAQ